MPVAATGYRERQSTAKSFSGKRSQRPLHPATCKVTGATAPAVRAGRAAKGIFIYQQANQKSHACAQFAIGGKQRYGQSRI